MSCAVPDLAHQGYLQSRRSARGGAARISALTSPLADAAPSGFGAIWTPACEEELQQEARWSDNQAWTTRAETWHTETEEDCAAEGEPDNIGPVTNPPGGIPGFVELFSGNARLCQAVKSELVGRGESWDVEDGPEFDLLSESNVQRILTAIRLGVYWWSTWGHHARLFRGRDGPA